MASAVSHEVGSVLHFCWGAPVHLLENEVEKPSVPVRDTMTDCVRTTWNRTLQLDKLTVERTI